ncbi:hypothetical protein EDD18DRAFT_1361305 [Armillaria luteobubalina]|uniref:Uncharacterized protein n=1 Tax=Armillaria luteobubalina TaxID=153913 RepID=A0AA39UM05_9AGAR|nr:hypothetical protein EDD18DRAFT_1361305 [Armillaria luteobubalina]
MVCDQDLARENAQLRVYFYVRALFRKVFLQLASSRENPPQKFLLIWPAVLLNIMLESMNVDTSRMERLRDAGRALTESTTAIDMSESTLKVTLVLSSNLHHCPLGNRCPHDFKNLQLGNLRTHIKTVHRDIQHLICQVCRPFVLTAGTAAFERHQAERHSGRRPARPPRTVSNPTPPTTPSLSPPALSRFSTPKTIELVPLATLNRAGPAPAPAKPPHCSFMIVDPRQSLPAEGPCLEPIVPPPHPREARKPYCDRAHSRAIPTLRNFLRDTCGIELTQCHHHAHH